MSKGQETAKTPAQHPMYQRGYRAGVKCQRRRSADAIEALKGSVEYWRQRYAELQKRGPR